MSRADVLVYGTVCLDRFILPGQTEDSALELPGGEAFNTATALAGWGLRVSLTGTATGSDAEGTRLRELLHSHPLAQGIDYTLVPQLTEAVTPVCTVRVDETGERFMNGRGFKQAIAPSLEPLLPLFVDRPIVAIDPNLGQATADAAKAAAAARCAVVAMDFAAIPEVVRVARIAVTSWEWLAREGTDASPEAAVRRLAVTGAKIGIVTLGAQGGLVCERQTGEVWSYSAVIPSEPIVDTTGAGDTFRAGLCYGLRRGWRLPHIIEFAADAAAWHCTQVGGGSRRAVPSSAP